MMHDLNEQNYQAVQESMSLYGESESRLDPVSDLMEYLHDYARENPGAAALWCLGIGFVLGWKLKPW